jgi:hypothetical protein
VSLSRSTPKPSSPVTPERKPQKVPPPAPARPSFKQCAALVGTLAFLKAGCATVHLRPEPGECPKEALDAMKKFNQPNPNNKQVWLNPDVKQPFTGKNNGAVFENGPITGAFLEGEMSEEFPHGTLLEGHLWVSAPGDHVFGQFTRARLPDGKTIPICLELCEGNSFDPPVGVPKGRPGPREGSVVMFPNQIACWTDYWH